MNLDEDNREITWPVVLLAILIALTFGPYGWLRLRLRT